MIAQAAGDQDAVAWARRGGREPRPATQLADAGRVDVDAVRLAALDHFGVAGYDSYARLVRRLTQRLHDAAQVGDRETFLQDDAQREIERRRPRHGEVVDRAANGKPADVAAGEEERFDDVGVGGEDESIGGWRQQRRVVQRIQEGVRQLGCEDRLDQHPGGLAAGPVGERHPFVAERRRAPTMLRGAVDPRHRFAERRLAAHYPASPAASAARRRRS